MTTVPESGTIVYKKTLPPVVYRFEFWETDDGYMASASVEGRIAPVSNSFRPESVPEEHLAEMIDRYGLEES